MRRLPALVPIVVAIALGAAAVSLAVSPPDAGTEPVGEARDQDPQSQTVKIKLSVSPAVSASVFWGRKKLGEVKPGKMTLELERPRNSGPLDIDIRAAGFLIHHLRMFTDRDDKLSVRLVRPGDASSLLGYRP
jgi:hypothetical protein